MGREPEYSKKKSHRQSPEFSGITERNVFYDEKNDVFLDENDEVNPVQTDTTDATFEFDNENAIVVNFKKKKQEE